MTLYATEKMLVLAAHPRPRIRIAETVNPGDFNKVRMAWRSSDTIDDLRARRWLLKRDETYSVGKE